MKIVRSHIPPRTINRDYRDLGILGYDFDNAYPQRITDIVNASGTAMYCIELYAKFIEGGGFKDLTFYKSVVNDKGLTLDKLLRKVTKDYANRRGFAIHVNYNGLFQICDMRAIPFHDCRLVHPDNTDYIGKIAVYNDWALRRKRRIKKEDIKFYDIFNPDPNVIANQIEAAGGIDQWDGQILWHSSEGENYPLAPYDAVIEDIETDGRIKNHKRKKAATGFNADYFFIHKGKFENEKERSTMIQDLEQFQGDESSGNMVLVECETDEQVPELIEIKKSGDGKDFYSINEISVQNNIRKRFGFPSVLTGELIPGKLGMAQEILDACSYVNGLTGQERRIFEETFQRLFSYWHIPALQINPTNDYSILPLQLIAVEATKEISIGETPTDDIKPEDSQEPSQP